MKIFGLFLKIPRQVVFLTIAIAVALPLIIPLGMPVNIMPQSKKLFDAIDDLNENSEAVLISCDFDPQSMPELYPMLVAMLNHCFSKKIKVILLALWPQGTGMVEMAIDDLASKYNIKSGEEYAFLGYKFGVAAVLLGMGENIKDVFPVDYYGTPIDSLTIMHDLRNYKDLSYVISLSAGDPGYRAWLLYAQARYGAKLGVGVTAVSAADVYPYVETGQVIGLLSGMKGASEYETMVSRAGYSTGDLKATQGMDAQSLGHLIIMIFIILGNTGYFFARRKK
ncbi:hypothetical protein A2Y85_01310 [candidate division WOR-3 bacterium RBG_13_43_14]|uniref:Uncharacterized protein n=1 Tax=candidate division WOR-3 bacterium RBG_13_43_14 TaxID=1802590 RepID=A0A1F4UCF1_UNCW3|nr:MAG: hypothetical protein A2Y85_01310 [candidate division WOR-3 bacterium RBG_13_43_14]